MATLFENATWVYNGISRNFGGTSWAAMTFTPQITHNITSVILRLGGDGSVGTITVSIRATDGLGKPTGADIDGVTGTTDGDTLPDFGWPTPQGDDREITFSSPISLTAGIKYAIVVRAQTTSGKWSTIVSDVYANGSHIFSGNAGGNWTVDATRDNWFEEYGELPVPDKPINPSPSDTATGVTLDESQLSWDDGGDADTFDVYFGPQGSVVLQSSAQAGTTWAIPVGTLSYGVTYEWRIDATNDNGTTTGDTWTFTALTYSPPVASGKNTMFTVKRLIAAASNKIWYESI